MRKRRIPLTEEFVEVTYEQKTKKKKQTEVVYLFKWNDDVSSKIWVKGNHRTKLLYKLAVKYGLLKIGRGYKDFF